MNNYNAPIIVMTSERFFILYHVSGFGIALNGAEKSTLERTLPLCVRCGCLRSGVGTTA